MPKENSAMSEHEEISSDNSHTEDSKTDVIASVAMIMIAVAFMIYWVSNQ